MSNNIIKSITINSMTHQSDDGQIQHFHCADVVTHETGSKTLHNHFSTDWVCIVEGEPYICRSEEGECLVDYHDEYAENTLPLEPFIEQAYCANDMDSPKALIIAQLSVEALANALNFDASKIEYVNVG